MLKMFMFLDGFVGTERRGRLDRGTALRVRSSATVEPILGPRTPTSLAQNFANSKGRPVDYFSCQACEDPVFKPQFSRIPDNFE